MDSENSTSDVLKFVGVGAVCVGAAWALQIVGFGDVTALNRLVWIMAAAAVAGGGLGTIVAASTLRRSEVPARV